MKDELDRARSRVFELEEEVERLKLDNQKTLARSASLEKENKRLHKTLDHHEQQLESQNKHVESLKHLAAKVR